MPKHFCSAANMVAWTAVITALILLGLPRSSAADETRQCDVVIVGAGGAGLAAASEAARSGASVIVVELGDSYGGTAAMSGGGCFAVGTPLQKAKGFDDNPELAFQDWIRWGRGEADEQWARYYIDHSLHDLYEWLEGIGVEWVDVSLNEGNTGPRWHRPKGFGRLVAQRLFEAARNAGVTQWLFGTQVDEIIIRNGRAVGVKGVNRSRSQRITITAGAVIMATGGFAGSHAAVERYAPRMRNCRFYVAGNPNCTGAGHDMVHSAGGLLTHMENLWMYIYATPDHDDPAGQRGLVLRFMPRSNGIWVNARGRRFHNEDLAGGASGTPAVLAQDPPFAWSVHDASVERTMLVMDPSYTADFSQMHTKKMRLLRTSPFIKSADTFDALADKMGVSAEVFSATIANYNNFIETRRDAEYGRNLKGLKKIEIPPFYAIQFFPAVRKTMGGVKTNLRCQVLDKNFHPVPGLYAAGELAGMAGGHIQGKAALEGTMLGPSIFSGRVAGAWAANATGKGKGFVGRPFSQ